METMYFEIYKEEDENWEVYLIIENKFPDLQGLDGIIITGSSSSAYDLSEDWKESLFKFISEVDKLKQHYLEYVLDIESWLIIQGDKLKR